MAGRSFFSKAIFKNPKSPAAPKPERLFGLAGDPWAMALVSGEGEITEAPADAMAGHLAALPRHSKVFLTVEKGRDIAEWLQTTGLFTALTDRGLKGELCLSGSAVVAVRLFKSLEAEQPFAVLVSLRNFDPGAQFVGDGVEGAALSCRKGLHIAQAVHEQFGVNIGLTPASTAFAAFRQSIDSTRPHFRPHRVSIEGLRESYFGGAVWASKRTVRNVRMYDMRGAYAWAMRQGVPIGRAAYTVAEVPDVPGFYRVRAVLSPRYPSPFMLRSEQFKGPGQATSRGLITETWASSLELALAREWGATYEVLEGWVFVEGTEPLFDTFVARVDQAERTTTGVARQTAKNFRNGLSGRLGRKPFLESVVIAGEQPGETYTPYYNARGPVGGMWSTRIEEEQSGLMPHWAAWITAQVRCRLLRAWVALVEAGSKVFYVDTDCLITDGVLETGHEFGDWQVRHVFKVFQVFARKVYAGYDERTGETVLAHAGIPRENASVLVEKFQSAYLTLKKPP